MKDMSPKAFAIQMVIWDDPGDRKSGKQYNLLVLASGIESAVKTVAPDEKHEIMNIQCIGPVSQNPGDEFRVVPTIVQPSIQPTP